MADKTASVRLDVKTQGFTQGLRGAEREAKSTAKSMGQAFSSGLNEGAKAGLDTFKSMFSTIKSGMASVGAIIGGVGFAGLVRGAIDSEQAFRKLAFSMGAGTGQFQKYQELQNQAHQSALKWKVNSDELAKAMGNVFDATGDANFTVGTIDEIAKGMRASGQSAETLAGLVGAMNEQFGITAEQVPEALAAVLSLGNRGSLSVQELGGLLGKMGKAAGAAGLEGQAGMQKMLGLVSLMEGPAGSAEAAVQKLNVIFKSLLGNAEKAKKLKLMGIDTKDKDAIELLGEVLGKTKGDPQKLSKIFGGDALMVSDAFEGIKDLDEAVGKASKSALTASDVEKEANKNKQSAAANLDLALETLKQAFTKPEMMTAISGLAENLPPLAEAVSKALKFAVESPFLAGGMLAGGNVLSSGLGAALKMGLSGALAGGGGGAATGLGGAASALSGSAASLSGAAGALLGAASVAAAIGGISLALDQAKKLSKDLDTRKKDKADRIKNNEHIAKLQGVEPDAVEPLAWEPGGWMQENLLAEKHQLRKHADKRYSTTKLEKSDPTMDDFMDALTDRRGGAMAPANQAAPYAMDGDDMRMWRQLQNSRTDLPYKGPMAAPAEDPKPKKVEFDSSALASAVGRGMSQKTLRVEVTNIDQIGGKVDGKGPGPGHQGPRK